MSKILKSTTLGNVKNGGIFKALGKEFVKLDADEHGCLVLAKDIWTKMPFRDGDDPECPNDLRRSPPVEEGRGGDAVGGRSVLCPCVVDRE